MRGLWDFHGILMDFQWIFVDVRGIFMGFRGFSDPFRAFSSRFQVLNVITGAFVDNALRLASQQRDFQIADEIEQKASSASYDAFRRPRTCLTPGF